MTQTTSSQVDGARSPLATPPEETPGHGLLLGRKVVVTAAAGTGIGFATARRALLEGADIRSMKPTEVARKLGVEARCVGYVGDQPVEALHVVLDDGEQAPARIIGFGQRQGLDGAAERGEGVLQLVAHVGREALDGVDPAVEVVQRLRLQRGDGVELLHRDALVGVVALQAVEDEVVEIEPERFGSQ